MKSFSRTCYASIARKFKAQSFEIRGWTCLVGISGNTYLGSVDLPGMYVYQWTYLVGISGLTQMGSVGTPI